MNRLSPAQERLARECRGLNGSIERQRFILADKAIEAEAKGIPAWAEIIGNACRRVPSTVYGWRRGRLLQKSVNKKSKLPISFWVSAADKITEANTQEILDWIAVCEKEKDMTIESARTHLPKTSKPEPAAPTLREELLAGAAVVEDIRNRPDLTSWVSAYMASAANQFENALRRLELEPAPDAEGERA